MSEAAEGSHAVVQLRRHSSSCSNVVFPRGSSPYRKRSLSAVGGEQHMKVCCPLTSSLERRRTQAAAALACDCHHGNHCTDVAAPDDFVNCSSFYANIYPSKISTKLRSINSNVLLPLTTERQQSSGSGSNFLSLPDLASAPSSKDGENFTMLATDKRHSVDDALVDSRWLFHRSFSSSPRSNNGTGNNKKKKKRNNVVVSNDELCKGEDDDDCIVGKTNSRDDHKQSYHEAACRSGGATQHTSHHDLSMECQQKLNAKTSCLPGNLPRNGGLAPMSALTAVHSANHKEAPLSCVCEESESSPDRNGELTPGWDHQTHEIIDVEKEEEMLRRASMVNKGLYKKGETPPLQTTTDYKEVIIEDVSDEEFQHKEADNNCPVIDLDEETKQNRSDKRKIPKLNLDDPLLKGFEVALDKISLSNPDRVSASPVDESLPVGDDPITKRAIERLDRKLQEVLKATSNRLATPASWNERPRTRSEVRGTELNGITEEVVQLRKNIKRPPTPKRRSACSPCLSPAETPPEPTQNAEAGPTQGDEVTAALQNEKTGPTQSEGTNEQVQNSERAGFTHDGHVGPKQHERTGPTADESIRPAQGEEADERYASTVTKDGGMPPTGSAKSLVTVEVNASNGESSLFPTTQADSSEGGKGIYKATFITPILRRKSPPRPNLGPLRTSILSDDEPLDLRSYRTNHSDRVLSGCSSPVWPRFSTRLTESINSSFSPQPPSSPLDYHRSQLSGDTQGILRNERFTIGAGYDSDKIMTQSPHLADGLWRWPNRDASNFFGSYEPQEAPPYRLTDSLSSMRVTSRRPLHAREQLRVFTDRPPTSHLSHIRSNSGDLGSFLEASPYTSSFRNYVGPNFLGSNQDPVDPIAKKALERFDCCTTNSPRTFGSSTPTVLSNSGTYDTYQDPIVRSAVMRMDNQLAAAYTANRRPSDYSLSRRSSINYIDTCDTIPEGSPLLSLREDGTSGSMAALAPKTASDGLRSREGSVPSSLVDQLENRSVHNMRHIFNYLEDHDYKLSHSQSTLKQTPSRQYFSCSREYTRPMVRPGESATSTDRRDKPVDDSTGAEFGARSPTPRTFDRLPPKRADQKDSRLSDQQFLRASSSYSNLYIPKDASASASVDFESSVINSHQPEETSYSARSTPAQGRRAIGIPITRQNSRRSQRPQKSGETADRCRSLERAPSSASAFARNTRTMTVTGSPRVSPSRNRRGLSVSTSQSKTSRNGRTSGQTENGAARRKLEQGQKAPQTAGRLKQPQTTLLGRRSQTPRLSVVNSPQKQSSESEQEGWNGGRTTPLKWQMSVFERLYYNRKR